MDEGTRRYPGMGDGTITLGLRSLRGTMARSIANTDNVLKRKMKEVENMTWQEFIPKVYHKYAGAFERRSDRGELPEHGPFDYLFRMIPGHQYWKGYKPDRSTDESKWKRNS
ncbi:hypothetical protein BDD12DRAFT_802981 [Trichophaea hybrida]|nr:hypothetical protein BDD12DRAFT_802981 [Trichophaea hybrida]